MSTMILNVLCEGQTEENFVKEVLKPYLNERGIVVKHRLLVTSRKKDAKGGLISYQKAKGDLDRWMKEVANHPQEKHYFTTMFDFYALPTDFPGYEEAKGVSDVYWKVQKIEEEFDKDMNMPRFIPYIQLHEFEALLFCDIEKLKELYPNSKAEIKLLERVLDAYQGNPELINSNPQTAPSKRIVGAIEGKKKYHYNKPQSGTAITKSIGMERLMGKCAHFRMWVEKMLYRIQEEKEKQEMKDNS